MKIFNITDTVTVEQITDRINYLFSDEGDITVETISELIPESVLQQIAEIVVECIIPEPIETDDNMHIMFQYEYDKLYELIFKENNINLPGISFDEEGNETLSESKLYTSINEFKESLNNFYHKDYLMELYDIYASLEDNGEINPIKQHMSYDEFRPYVVNNKSTSWLNLWHNFYISQNTVENEKSHQMLKDFVKEYIN